MTTFSALEANSVEDIGSELASSAHVRHDIKYREYIYRTIKEVSPVSLVHRQTIQDLINVFSTLHILDPEKKKVPIKCTYGSASRIVGSLKVGDTLTLPLITISKEKNQTPNDRNRYESIIVHEKYWDDEKQRAIRLLTLPPRPIDIIFNVNIWTKYVEDMDQLSTQVFLKFNPSLDIWTDKSLLTKAFLTEENKINTYFANSMEDRTLQKGYTITVHTYVTYPKFKITSTGQIERFLLDKRFTTE